MYKEFLNFTLVSSPECLDHLGNSPSADCNVSASLPILEMLLLIQTAMRTTEIRLALYLCASIAQ